MISFPYRFKDISGIYKNYQLTQSNPAELWCIYEDDILLARLSNINQSWKQLSGDTLPKELIRGAGTYIQQTYYDSVALKIKDRWPGIISQAEKKSDSQIMIICKPQVNLNIFRPIFCKHVSRLFNQEVSFDLNVHNYNFTQDFNFKLEVRQKR